jgi:DnaJ family protein C protein 3
MKGNLNAAVELHSRAIQLSPKNPLHYYNRAATYLNLGRTELAGQDLESALQLDPEFDPARKLLRKIGKK